MKEIKAIIQPHMLTAVIDSLRAMGDLPGLTVSEVRGFGRGRAQSLAEPLGEGFLDYAKRAKLEIVVPDDLADLVVDTIRKHARTGHSGDGLIFVSPVQEVLRIRTGEREHSL